MGGCGNMNKNTGQRIEKTRTEIDVISKECNNVKNLGRRPKQLLAKDTSHGLVSEMLIKGNGIEKANILYRTDKIMNGKEISVINTPVPVIRIKWKNGAGGGNKGGSSNKEKTGTLSFRMQGRESKGNQEKPHKEQRIAAEPRTESSYSPTLPLDLILPVPIYLNQGDKSTACFTTKGKTEKITGKRLRAEKYDFSVRSIDKTSCHDGRKLEETGYANKETEKPGNIRVEPPTKSNGYLKKSAIGQNFLYLKKADILKFGGKRILFSDKKSIYVGKGCTSCHNGRKFEGQHASRKESSGVHGKQGTGRMAVGRKRVTSSLCASYRALRTAGSVAASTGMGGIAAVSENMSKLSEEGGELQAASETVFMAKDAVRNRRDDKHTEKKAERTKKKHEKKRDTLLEQKAEIRQCLAKKKTEGTPLSKEEIAMLEKKLGIASKKEKGEQNVSDRKSKKLEKLQKSNSKKLRKTEGKLKNIPKKATKEMWKRNIAAQRRFQARSYIISRLTDPNNESEGTGLGGMFLSFAKTAGFGFLQNTFKKIGSLLLKILAPALPAILAVIIVPILCLLLIGGIAGGNEEENQAQAQETSPETDYYLSSFDVLYGHANSTITNNVNIMKWKSEVKKELQKQGFDESWTDMVLCMMWQESKGLGNDIMQSGGATPKDSIRAGISVLKAALVKCSQYKSTDIKLVLYCYNYGPGFADYIYKEWDGTCSEKAAQARTNAMLSSHPEWTVYGDPKYAQHVLQNYVFEENTGMKPDSTKWCQIDKNNISKCALTSVTSFACKFIGNKYVWGGTSLTNGCDCSGFTQQIYKHFGVNIPRTSSTQSQSGKKISSLSDAKPGDLLFYGEGGKVNHVALYLGNNTIVHASNSKPYPSGGIKTTSPANYRPILAIRRYMK